MTHRNTPAKDTGVAPSVLLFGRPIRDHLPRQGRELRSEWNCINDAREIALAKRVHRQHSSDLPPGKSLDPLSVGDPVQIQNQSGNRPNKWYNTGIVSECLPNRQYNIVVDGSRRVTLRNRRFLRKIAPLTRTLYPGDGEYPICPPNEFPDSINQQPATGEMSPLPPMRTQPDVTTHVDNNVENNVNEGLTNTPLVPGSIRRSTRKSVKPDVLQVKLHGKSHC